MNWRTEKKNVLFIVGHRAGQVGRMGWARAYTEQNRGNVRFISNTLYKAARLGIDITKIKKPNDKKLKARIVEARINQGKTRRVS